MSPLDPLVSIPIHQLGSGLSSTVSTVPFVKLNSPSSSASKLYSACTLSACQSGYQNKNIDQYIEHTESFLC